MKRSLCLMATAILVTACNMEPGSKEIGWRSEKQSNNPETMLETGMKTSGHYRAWVGHTMMDIESAWGEPESFTDTGGGSGTAYYKKGREYENMNSETWFEYCEVTLQVGAGEIIQSVDYQGQECRHSLMQFKYQTP